MVVSTKAVVVLVAVLVLTVVLAELVEALVAVDTSVLMAALLLYAGGVGGWFARHHRLGMGDTREDAKAPTES